MRNIALSVAISLSLVLAGYLFVPLAVWDALSTLSRPQTFGATITTIAGTDTLSSSRAVINTNFANLNADKAELTGNNAFTGLNTFLNSSSTKFSCLGPCYFGQTATSSFSTAGALTLATPLTTANGGTGSTTLSFGQVLTGSTTNSIGTVNGYGTSGQTLTSNGAGLPPTWQSAIVDTSIYYNWTSKHDFSQLFATLASSTNATSTTSHYFPFLASTMLKVDSTGKLIAAVAGTDYAQQQRVAVSNNQVRVNNTTSTTTLIAFPSNVLTASSTIRFTATGVSAGAVTCTLRLSKSTGTVLAQTQLIASGSSGYWAQLTVVSNNSTSAQVGSGYLMSNGYDSTNSELLTTSAIDVTQATTLSLVFVSSAGVNCDVNHWDIVVTP